MEHPKHYIKQVLFHSLRDLHLFLAQDMQDLMLVCLLENSESICTSCLSDSLLAYEMLTESVLHGVMVIVNESYRPM